MLTDEEVFSGIHLNHCLKLTNMGRTPATVLAFELGHSPLGDEGINGPIGEIVKDIDNKEFDRVIAGGESIQETPININEFLNKSISDAKKFVGFYGLIKYRHIFSKVNVEEFVFRYAYSPYAQGLIKIPQPQTDNAKQ